MADSGNHISLAFQHAMINEHNLEIRQLVAKKKLVDKASKIQILVIGKENNKPTKSFLLIGQTGAGKTTLLNGMINYIMKSNFEDNFRYSVKDETGSEAKGVAESQTEFVTAYLIYHQPGMAVDCNFMIIDSPGLGDTRGRAQQIEIKKQMEKFLYEDQFGVNELHCLGFVINGTINRSHGYLKGIIHEFESMFGKDTIHITKILATHTGTDSENPAVSQVLGDLKIKSDKLYTFDNGILFCSNQGNKKRIQMGQLKWEFLADQYEEFFEDMMVASPGSLKLCKQSIAEKMMLERSLLMLKKQIDHRLRVLLQCNSTRKLHEKYNQSLKSNEKFEGEETYTVKERSPINGRYTHAHNCPKCEQTCVYPCTTLKYAFCQCPKGDDACEVCPCSKNDHKSEKEVIESHLKTRRVSDDMMKRDYEEAKKQIQSTKEKLEELDKEASQYLTQMATFIKQTVQHITRINEIARNPNPKAPEEYIYSILEDIRETIINEINDPLDKEYMVEVLNALPEQVDQVVLQETNQKTGLKDKFLAFTKNYNPFGQ